MSEKVNESEKTTKATTPAKKPAAERPAKATEKEGWFKRTKKRIRNAMSNHPFLTAFTGAAVGSATTVAAGYGAKKVIESSRAKKAAAYIPDQNNPLDPNV